MDLSRLKSPPRYVPTLTEVVTGLEEPVDTAEPPMLPVEASALPAAASSAQAQEQMVQRLLQRAGLVLEQRLQACIAQVVQEQTHAITVRLQQELESVVRQTLYEAVVEELAPRSD